MHTPVCRRRWCWDIPIVVALRNRRNACLPALHDSPELALTMKYAGFFCFFLKYASCIADRLQRARSSRVS